MILYHKHGWLQKSGGGVKILEESQEAGEAKKPRSEEAEKHSKSLEAKNKKQ